MADLLFIEHEDRLRAVLAGELRDAGFRVREVGTVEEGLNIARREGADLVLLDISMPPGEMAGIDALFKLREQPTSQAIPVVVLSGIGDILNPELMQFLGVAAVVAKPEIGIHLLGVTMKVLLAAARPLDSVDDH